MASDAFMGAIETITSSTRKVKQKDGTTKEVLIWNATVANLSLMALGSSAPEILLSCIELFLGNFQAGELGPGTIVGSAAFNLLVISAVCIAGLPGDETRMIKDLRVFALTAGFSIFAYVWLAVIVVFLTPGEVTIAEAVITLLGFPCLIGGAFGMDKGCWRKPKVAPKQPAQSVAPSAGAVPPFAKVACGDESTTSASGGGDAAPAPPSAPPSPPETALAPAKVGFKGLSATLKLPPITAGKDGEQAAQAQDADKKVTNVATFWGQTSGTLSEEQVREIKLNQLKKNYRPATQSVRKDMIQQLTAAKGPKASPESRKRSVLAHARSEQDLTATPMEEEEEEEPPYLQRVKRACLVNGGDAPGTPLSWVGHIISVPWKLLMAVAMPSNSIGGGWPAFVTAITLIGSITFLIDEVATMFGCLVGLSSSMTAITFVALGTSLPDTLASRTAALNDDYADDSIGNITGSNSVNVFLGIGLPWTIGAIYWAVKTGEGMPVPAGDLGFNVVIFLAVAAMCLALIAFRRRTLGYELGGKHKKASGAALVLLWMVYILFCALNSYGVITVQLSPSGA